MYTDLEGRALKPKCKNLLVLSLSIAFVIGLTFGALLAIIYLKQHHVAEARSEDDVETSIKTVLVNHSYEKYQTVSFIKEQSSEKIIADGVFWGPQVEAALPAGFSNREHSSWTEYVASKAVAVQLEVGCGRMQNRMVVFADGRRACVRYRQNTDQIQGELFSFYLAKVLKLSNLAPSSVSVVDVGQKMWRNVAEAVGKAQWHNSKPVVLTEYVEGLTAANIPAVLRPSERHLNKFDVFNMTVKGKSYVELAQWSDLIVFDYLTANLDRIVNNLYNYQWNNEIMNAPAHNLARQGDLLLFLDNESGLLHGYRLLKKYEVYHSSMLENLCVFRKRTVDVVKELKTRGDVGERLRRMFEEGNTGAVKELLPSLPEKSVKILNERIARVYEHVVKCEEMFGRRREEEEEEEEDEFVVNR